MKDELIAQIESEAPPESKTIEDKVLQSIIPQGVSVPEPEVLFGINGIHILTKGSVSVLAGKAKAGKTTVTAWLASQMIQKSMKVLWLDTEQGLYYGSRTQHWILSIAKTLSDPNLIYLNLREYRTDERGAIMERAIQDFEPDLVVLDGVRDLVYDINDTKEATNVAESLMHWTTKYNLSLLSILHTNKTNGEIRGHVGAELKNKSESVIRVENDKDNGRVICSSDESRGKQFETFAFDRDDNGIPHIIEDYTAFEVSNNIQKKEAIMPNDPTYSAAHVDIINKMFSKTEWLKYSEVLDQIKLYFGSHGVKFGDSKARVFLEYYRNESLMIYDRNKKGHDKWRSGLVNIASITPNEDF